MLVSSRPQFVRLVASTVLRKTCKLADQKDAAAGLGTSTNGADEKPANPDGDGQGSKELKRPPISKRPVSECDQIGLSLSGCGFLTTYHWGAVLCLKRHAPKLLSRVVRFSGASAGSLVAALLLLAPQDVEHGLSLVYKLADELNALPFGALTPKFSLASRLEEIVSSSLPDDISIANGRLFVSVTDCTTLSNEIFSNFTSRQHLLDCLMASCYIPIYSAGPWARAPQIGGRSYMDGGYSNNLPEWSDLRTVTISPFASDSDITPADPQQMFEWSMSFGGQLMRVNKENIMRGAQALFPNNRQELRRYYSLGFRNAFTFLRNNGLLEREHGDAV